MNELKLEKCYYDIHVFYKPYESKCLKNYRYWIVNGKLHMTCVALKECIDRDTFQTSSFAELVKQIARKIGLDIIFILQKGLIISTRNPTGYLNINFPKIKISRRTQNMNIDNYKSFVDDIENNIHQTLAFM